MAVQDVTLNPKIREAAIEVFLERGYSDASLTEICARAGVTTGAIYKRYKGKEELFSSLVEPTIEILQSYSYNHAKDCLEIAEKDGMAFNWQNMEDDYMEFLNLLYDNFQGFKLLICKANGSKYSNFINDIIDDFSVQSYEFFKLMHARGEIKNLIDINEYHLIYTASYTAMFEVIEHDFRKEDAIKYYKTLNKFFNWEEIFKS